MWNIGSDMNFRDQRNGNGIAGSEMTPVQKFPSVDGSQLSLAESSVHRNASFHAGVKFSSGFSVGNNINLSGNLQNGVHQTFFTGNTQRINQGMHMAHNHQPERASIGWTQGLNGQYADPNNYSVGQQMKVVEFQKSGLDKTGFAAHVTGPSPINVPSVEDLSHIPTSQNFMHSLPNMVGPGRFLPYPVERVPPYFNMGSRDSVTPNLSSTMAINMSYESDPSEYSQLANGQTGVSVCDSNLGIKNINGSIFYVGTAVEARNDGYRMDMSTSHDVSEQVPAVMEINQARDSCHFPKVDAQLVGSQWGNVLGTSSDPQDLVKNDQSASEISSETYKKACDALLAYAQMKRSTNESLTSKNADGLVNGDGNVSARDASVLAVTDITVGRLAGACENEPSLRMGRASFSGTPASSEVLWDGTLQLNASTEVLAIAVFKSGEKVLDASWAKYVDVKGKVRLEAFEKFVQELPRSRNRALMVISIHWKAGTSDSGLKGMKEVAKGYKEQQRVGYAQFSSGVDLYVCPRSDAVITILAKHGFLKGMRAVEEDQDSLIGCVVWRRNKTTSDLPSTDLEMKAQPITDPVDQASSSSSSLVNPSGSSPPALENEAFTNNCNPSLSSLLLQLKPLTSQMDLSQSSEDLCNLLSGAVRLLVQDAAENRQPPQPVLHQREDGQPSAEEDLPEFDFGDAARGPPSSSMHGPYSGLKQSAIAQQGVEKEKWPSGMGSKMSPMPGMPGTMSYFDGDDVDNDGDTDGDDDDDDMPEWCPPGAEKQRPPLQPSHPPPLLPSPLLASQSWAAIPLPQPRPYDQNQGASNQDQRGILGQCPIDLYPKIPPLQARLDGRTTGLPGRRSPPVPAGRSRPKKQRRMSGWDVKPSDGKSSRRSRRRSRGH